jgi:glycine C-acetyltransferase
VIDEMPGSLDYLKEELAKLEAAGTALHPRVLQREQRARTRFDGRDVINLASNNYLGLAAHPRLKEAAAKAAMEYGAGTGAVRTIAGTMSIHRELERRFAEFKGAEDALMFQSGFTSNSGTVAAILTKEDVIVSDQLNHASIIDGARLSRAEIKVFDHKDVDAADALLQESKAPGRRQLLITDGVFSMDGDIAPLPDLVALAETHGAIMMIDDAHASGVLGTAGKGTASHFDIDPARVDIQVGTLSKAIGVLGGFIAGPRHLIDWLVNRGRPFLFSTSAPPGVTAACLAALDVMRDEPERLARLWSNTRMFKEGLHALGFDTGSSETPITPVIAGEETKAVELSALLWEEGVFTPAIVFPTVPKGRSRVRTIVTADHSEDDLREALEAFERVGKKLALI